MTAYGVAAALYAERVEQRPHSRFTMDPTEIAANDAWRQRVIEWGQAQGILH